MQGNEQVSAIYVSGSGSASAKANEAALTVGVQNEDEDASTAMGENSALMNLVIAAIDDVEGVETDYIKTVAFSVQPIYDWEEKTYTGYRVTNMVQVEISTEIDVGEVIDAATGAGANSVQGISFGLTDASAEQLKTDAYVQALQDARGKADLIAETLGLEITGVLSVSESVYNPYTPYRGYAESSLDSASAPTPILEGTLSVSVNVQVAFTFQ